ncbi:MAG TPA: DUF2344 domain-containing protein, partial [Polyangiaceae bacterium]|nr:DUF2344 domain-containing protein [Polyangiaceae bacterium]
ASLDEYIDVKLIDGPPAAELTERLAAHASGGLRFLGACQLEQQDKGVAAVITAARYLLALPESVVAEAGGLPFVEAAIAEFLAKPEFIVRRSIDGLGKKVDVRHFVQSLRIGGDAERDQLVNAGLLGDLLPIEAVVALGPTGSSKAAEVVEALFGPNFPHKAVRAQLLAGAYSPLDTASLRSTQKVVEASLAAV